MVLSDEVILIERAQKGDTSAFEELVMRYTGLVGSIAYNIVGDVHLAGDLTQEAFLKAYHGLKNLQEPSKFKGWLSSIIRTTCVDWLRKERLKSHSLERLSEDGIEPFEKLTLPAKPPSKEQEELRERVLNAVGSLPKIYQEIIFLKHLRGFTYKEMSDFLGVPIATIESRLYRARLMLKERLQDLYNQEE
jgi:RNA polymerase sigma-70 factor (ECF subfamily)